MNEINDRIIEDSDIGDSDLGTVSYCGLQLGKIGRLRCGEGLQNCWKTWQWWVQSRD